VAGLQQKLGGVMGNESGIHRIALTSMHPENAVFLNGSLLGTTDPQIPRVSCRWQGAESALVDTTVATLSSLTEPGQADNWLRLANETQNNILGISGETFLP
jgi:hypothetical protein